VLRDGLIPSHFSGEEGEAEYDAADASLWFILAVECWAGCAAGRERRRFGRGALRHRRVPARDALEHRRGARRPAGRKRAGAR
jgi:hypothetical protein